MEIIEVAVEEIKPYKNNAKKHDEKQIKNVAESIKQFGFRQPIVLDKDNVIIIGHCRFEAAKVLGLTVVPCHYAEDLTNAQVKKLRNLDNKLNESEWDFNALRLDLKELDFDGFDLDWGLPEEEQEAEVVEEAREYINSIGGFEKFAEWGVILKEKNNAYGRQGKTP